MCFADWQGTEFSVRVFKPQSLAVALPANPETHVVPVVPGLNGAGV